MLSTPYGRMLAFKILLFVATVVVALINRFGLALGIASGPGALQTPSRLHFLAATLE